jgi:type I restriction enzyme S subunit
MSSIPMTKDWASDRLKDVAAINSVTLSAGTDPYYEFDYLEISNVDYHGIVDPNAIEHLRFEDAPSRARRQVAAGSTVISSVRPNLQAIAFFPDAPAHFVCSTGFNVVEPKVSRLSPQFAYYYLISENARQYFEAAATGVGYPAVGDKAFNAIDVPLPPLPEQRNIAAYLDASCAAIDAAVAAKRRQLETLDSLRKSIIQRTITNGLNLCAVMRDSGSDGIGEIPSHWRTDRMKDVVALRNEKIYVANEEADYLELEDIESGTGRILNRRNTLEVESAVTLFEKGDILFGKLRPYLEKYVQAGFDGKCTGEILAFKPIRIKSRFLFYCIASPWFIGQCKALSYGAKMPRVNWQTQLAAFNLPLPPAEEQEAICGFLDTKLGELWRIVGSIESQITTLTAYRKSLIHECVTGQRRVTEEDVQCATHINSIFTGEHKT